MDEETTDEDELDPEMTAQILQLAADLRQPVTDKFATLRKVEAFFIQHYGEHVFEIPSYELGMGPIAVT